MDKIVIIGGGSFIGNLINYIESMKSFIIVGYTDIDDMGSILSVPYLGTDEILNTLYKEGIRYAALGVGNRLNATSIRQKLVTYAKNIGFEFPVIIGSNVVIHKGVILGEGVIIRDSAIVQSNCNIGDFVMIGDNAVITHDTKIGKFAQIVTGCILGNSNNVGESAFLGYNVVTVNKITITSKCVIGAKSLVNKDCVESGLYFGHPALLKKKY